jgi:hypothetical protein
MNPFNNKISSKHWSYLTLCWLLIAAACGSNKHVTTNNTKKQIAEYSVDWLKYKIYLLPQDTAGSKKHRNRADKNIKLSIMVINMKDNFSPLRKLCSDIDQYNIYNEYLLNGAKNEIYLQTGTDINYPVYYAFENNYNAFPFETINVGYKLIHKKKDHSEPKLVFVDRVFSKDTITFNLTSSLK